MQPTIETQAVAPEGPKMSIDDILDAIVTCLDDNKAEDLISINLAGKSSLADHMVIASGRSARQVSALADYVIRMLKENGMKGITVEGLSQADWVLIDTGDVLVHLFRPEVRSFYNLDKMWTTDLGEDNHTAETLN